MITEETLSEWSEITNKIESIIGRMVPPYSTICYISKTQDESILVSFYGSNGDPFYKLFTFKQILQEASK